jgi:hypothetical protein
MCVNLSPTYSRQLSRYLYLPHNCLETKFLHVFYSLAVTLNERHIHPQFIALLKTVPLDIVSENLLLKLQQKVQIVSMLTCKCLY